MRQRSTYSHGHNQTWMETLRGILKKIVVPELEFAAINEAQIVEIRIIGVLVKLLETQTPLLIHVSQLDPQEVAANNLSILLGNPS